MCGITGYKTFKEESSLKERLKESVETLFRRGPDDQSLLEFNNVGLGHTRLSIVDTSANGNQPMSDESGRYTLIFNGEIYNHLELKKDLNDVRFNSTCDTEVLLHLLIKERASCLTKLNGFFAIAFYDKEEDSLLLARDRMGIKPLLYYQDQNQFIFGSEMKALLCYPIPKSINQTALYWYLKLNYLPGNLSMIKGVSKLEPGHYIHIKGSQMEKKGFSEKNVSEPATDYDTAKGHLVSLLEQSVRKRLMADVPLGSFLSGGTDSSAVVALASRHHPNLHTYSIGYKDQPFFDETEFAELVADKFKTNHTTFSLTNDDLLSDLENIINYIDEPFADSSSIPTYILCKHTSEHLKVALSGDGADELFGGYYKHLALNKVLHSNVSGAALRLAGPLLKMLPKSRSGSFSNLVRRLDRFGEMQALNSIERYWFLASLTNDPSFIMKQSPDWEEVSSLKEKYLPANPDMNDYLIADQHIVLPGDMLTKVDLMSMANSLEVRVPFLDKEVVAFARSLPISYKINGNERKRILQDAFKEILPKEIYHRSKKGFEVPLLQWMRNELLTELDHTLFDTERIEDQGFFEAAGVMALRNQMLSNNPGDVHGLIWALYVFQKWYANYF